MTKKAKVHETTLEEELGRAPTEETEEEEGNDVKAVTVAHPVLYQEAEDQPAMAAMVTKVDGVGQRSLAIFDPLGRVLYKHRVSFSAVPKIGTWRLPEFA